MEFAGTAVVDGYGLIIRVDKSHLTIIENGVTSTYTRAGSGLRRIVIIGKTGSISLHALQWCGLLGIPVVCLAADGTLLWTSAYAEGGSAKSNGRLLRAQALAMETRVGINLARDILRVKLELTADQSPDELARAIRTVARVDVPNAREVAKLRAIEGTMAAAYFASWSVPVRWCRSDGLPRQWNEFTTRKSLVTGRNRAATDPVNATLNYLLTIAASQCRIACYALGLSPLLGFLHNDGSNSEPLVYDLLETVRPVVEMWVRQLFARGIFCRDLFKETTAGVCKIAPGQFLKDLTATGPLWMRAVAPYAEMIMHTLAKTSTYKIDQGTPLTASNNRTAHGRREYEAINPAEWEASFPSLKSCAKCR